MLSLTGAGYRYPSSATPAVAGVDLAVEPGEIVLLTGPTGCGKSTVLRLAAGLLGRHGSGVISGAVEVDGRDPAHTAPRERVGLVGFVAQNPSRQVITGTLGDEVAFAMESAGAAPSSIAPRVRAMLDRVGLPYTASRSTTALSGGERQRLMVAAALSAGARLLLLDEPLAHLDPTGAAALMGVLRDLADTGVAVLIVEHRLGPTLPVADRVAVMNDGGILAIDPADAVDAERLGSLGLRLPEPTPWPLRRVTDAATPRDGAPLLEAAGLYWTWPGADAPTLADIDLVVSRGERIALLGPNGAGKSTLLGALTGALRTPVRRGGRVVAIPQDPDLALFCPTVADELAYGPREAGASRAEAARIAAEVATGLSVDGLEERAPQALSRGQRLRVAVASALACRPDVLVLDEPTSGQDHDQVERMMQALRAPDRALLFATHDVPLALRHATRVVVMEQGRITIDAPTEALA